MYSLATLHNNCLAVIYVLILARPHTSKAVLLHHVTPALAMHRLPASPASQHQPAYDVIREDQTIGTLQYNWPMSAHGAPVKCGCPD